MAETKQLNLPISRAVHDACKKLAQSRGLKLYALIEAALTAYLISDAELRRKRKRA